MIVQWWIYWRILYFNKLPYLERFWRGLCAPITLTVILYPSQLTATKFEVSLLNSIPVLKYLSRLVQTFVCERSLEYGTTVTTYTIQCSIKSQTELPYDQMPAASKINDVMATIIPLIKTNQYCEINSLKIDYLSTLSNQILSMLYHKALDEEWNNALQKLLCSLKSKFNYIIGRARKQKVVTTQDFVTEVLPIHGKNYHFKQIENSHSTERSRQLPYDWMARIKHRILSMTY